MAICSKVEWTNCTWNPVTGCTKISSGWSGINCFLDALTFVPFKRLVSSELSENQTCFRHGCEL